MGQLDPGGRRDDALVHARADLGGQQGEQRPEPLAPRLGEVHRGPGDERVGVVDLGAQPGVDRVQPLLQPGGELGRGRGQ